MSKIHSVTPAQTGWRYVLIDGDTTREEHVAVWFSMGDEEGILWVLPGIADETGTVDPVNASDYDEWSCVGLFGPLATEEEIHNATVTQRAYQARQKEKVLGG